MTEKNDPRKILRALSGFDSAMKRSNQFYKNIPSMTRMRIIGMSRCPECGASKTLIQAKYGHLIDLCDNGHITELKHKPTPESFAN
jgi:hypothetical protein